jgi:DNA-binding XRE family transcriptional regulator
MTSRRWISPLDFADLRKEAGMTRKEAAKALDVTPRTVQNWEMGGARIPWMAYRMLRILRGYALPGVAWEGWTMRDHQLFSPAGRAFDASWLEHAELVFAQAKLWRQMYAKQCKQEKQRAALKVVPFLDRSEGALMDQLTQRRKA